MLIFQDDRVIFNVFETMHHHNEKSQCYYVDLVKYVVEEVSQNESPLLPIKWVIVNFIDTIEEGHDK